MVHDWQSFPIDMGMLISPLSVNGMFSIVTKATNITTKISLSEVAFSLSQYQNEFLNEFLQKILIYNSQFFLEYICSFVHIRQFYKNDISNYQI